ncbi:MAG TPA: guanylate kinase [Longimicrobium sp.]|nr:guanylate kinase [Longimicrobium sp.]
MSAPATFPLVLSAASGTGKTTLARELRRRRPDVVFSVSATTRPPRAGEVDGRDYHFVSIDEFGRMIEAGEMIEWAEVHGNFYGTPWKNVRETRARGEYLLLDIDVQGARQVRGKVPEAVDVFILPPSGHDLARRLEARGTEAPEVLARRLRNARDEIRAAGEFRHVIVNDVLARAADELEKLLRGEGASVAPVPALEAEIDRLCTEIEAHLGTAAPDRG